MLQGSQGGRPPQLPPALAGLYPHLMPVARDVQPSQQLPPSASAAQHQASPPPLAPVCSYPRQKSFATRL